MAWPRCKTKPVSNNNRLQLLILATASLAVVACSTTPAPTRPASLRDIDLPSQEKPKAAAPAAPKTRDEIRQAYLEYLQHASKDERVRADALHRLARLEFEIAENRPKDAAGEARDRQLEAAAERTIALMQTLLRDQPQAKDNDRALYQLARAYDQRGLSDQSIEALSQLVRRYPSSPYFIESQFRIAENRFIRGDYVKAEDLYTEVLVARNNARFREKALYKRGWARLKQGFYPEAVDDFIAATNLGNFADLEQLSAAKRNDFDEYLRALSLSFIYMGGPSQLHDYFKSNTGFRYIYHTYLRTSDIYLAQERYADAVQALTEFRRHYPKSTRLPQVALKIVDIWRMAGFSNNFLQALDEFYVAYHPQSQYWSTREASAVVRNEMAAALKEHVVAASGYLHKEYQASNKEPAFAKAKLWYERYFKHYQASARKDNAHYLYAELLSQHNDQQQALAHYELAGFDGELVVNKDAAYAAVVTVTKLYEQAQTPAARDNYRTALIDYSQRYVESYRNDPRAFEVATHAVQQAYGQGRYAQAIALAELYANAPLSERTQTLNRIKANAYFKAERYPDAEAAYQALLQQPTIDAKAKQHAQENLALSIYHQGAAAKAANRPGDAIYHYARISALAPDTDTAASGLYDAIALAYDQKLWADSVKYIERFKKLYPSHRLARDASIKLSVAYLNTNQETAAASELIKLSRSDEKLDYKIAALWKAAGLYESKRDHIAAINAYEEYAATYQRPYPQYVEAVNKLIELNAAVGDSARADKWRQQILDSDKRTPVGLKTDRTNYLCSSAALALAAREQRQFDSIRLALPLNRSLRYKKDALQKTLTLYGLVTSYGVRETVTQATHAIGEIYYTFSKSLLESERPKGLSAIERDQYKALLEDQAFPFEDNAIKFYEKNIQHTKQGIFDQWVRDSYDRLKLLYPARYNREVLVESYVNVVH